ncbi:MAG: hypothetical protein KF807_00215 [Xanthobacteraceae bacterium]|nr:hypothetical protein [Xanthobacteraceae bacterium]
MTTSFTLSESHSFTLTHARHLAAKVAADLKRIQRLFTGGPSDADIAEYEAEITELLKAGYLDTVTYGFRRDDTWIEPTIRFTAKDLQGAGGNDDDPGRIRPGSDVTNAKFYSFLTYSASWHRLPSSERDAFKSILPFQRNTASEPRVDGTLVADRTYSSGGVALDRFTVRSK